MEKVNAKEFRGNLYELATFICERLCKKPDYLLQEELDQECEVCPVEEICKQIDNELEGIKPEEAEMCADITAVGRSYSCGACGEEIRKGTDKYCPHCGRKVDWGEENE